MAMTELALAGAKAGAAEPVVIDAALAAPSAGNGSICTGPRLSLSIAIYVASRPEICRRIHVLLCRPQAAAGASRGPVARVRLCHVIHWLICLLFQVCMAHIINGYAWLQLLLLIRLSI